MLHRSCSNLCSIFLLGHNPHGAHSHSHSHSHSSRSSGGGSSSSSRAYQQRHQHQHNPHHHHHPHQLQVRRQGILRGWKSLYLFIKKPEHLAWHLSIWCDSLRSMLFVSQNLVIFCRQLYFAEYYQRKFQKTKVEKSQNGKVSTLLVLFAIICLDVNRIRTQVQREISFLLWNIVNGLNFQVSSSGAPKGLSPPASQLNNTVHHHSRQQLHHDVASSRKRNRSRSPSPQLVKMYSAGAPRPVTPRGSALSPVAHGVNSICLPGTNSSPHASRTLFDQALAASGYVNTTLANLHANSAAAAAHSARFAAATNSANLPPQVAVDQLTASSASPYHHHVSSAGVPPQHQAAAVYQQHAAARQNLSH